MPINYAQLRKELIDEFQLNQLSEEKQNELLDKMTEALMKKIMIDTVTVLGETGTEAYEKFLETNPDIPAIDAYLTEKIPNYSGMIQRIIDDFKKEMKG